MSYSHNSRNVPATPTTKHASVAQTTKANFVSQGPTNDKPDNQAPARSGRGFMLTGSDGNGTKAVVYAQTKPERTDAGNNPVNNWTGRLQLTPQVDRTDSVTGEVTKFFPIVKIEVQAPTGLDGFTVADLREMIESAFALMVGPFDGTTGVGTADLLTKLFLNNTDSLG